MTHKTVYTYYLLLVLLIGTMVAKPLTDEDKNDSTEIQSKAGISNILNPANLPGLNLINNTLPSLSPNQNDPLKDVKLFFLTVQGAVMPGNVFTGNVKGILQGLGNIGKFLGSN